MKSNIRNYQYAALINLHKKCSLRSKSIEKQFIPLDHCISTLSLRTVLEHCIPTLQWNTVLNSSLRILSQNYPLFNNVMCFFIPSCE